VASPLRSRLLAGIAGRAACACVRLPVGAITCTSPSDVPSPFGLAPFRCLCDDMYDGRYIQRHLLYGFGKQLREILRFLVDQSLRVELARTLGVTRRSAGQISTADRAKSYWPPARYAVVSLTPGIAFTCSRIESVPLQQNGFEQFQPNESRIAALEAQLAESRIRAAELEQACARVGELYSELRQQKAILYIQLDRVKGANARPSYTNRCLVTRDLSGPTPAAEAD